MRVEGDTLRWDAEADLESGLASFLIERDGDRDGEREVVARVPEEPRNPHGRPLFQGLQYSDTPARPLRAMAYRLPDAQRRSTGDLVVRAVNTVGLISAAPE